MAIRAIPNFSTIEDDAVWVPVKAVWDILSSEIARINQVLAGARGADGTLLGSGTYIPTATIAINADTAVSAEARWSRVGDVVTVSGELNINPTALALVQIDLTLPVPSNIPATGSLSGIVASPNTAIGTVRGAPTVDQAALRFIPVDTIDGTYRYVYQYQVQS